MAQDLCREAGLTVDQGRHTPKGFGIEDEGLDGA
jgi:hypothetical protein